MHDVINSIAVVQAVAPQVVSTAAVSSPAIDLQGCESLGVIIAVGDIADTLDATHRLDVKIEHAEDDGTGAPAAYVPCSAADLGGAEANGGVFLSVNAAAREKTRHLVSYQGGKRFVRLSVTPVGLTAGGPVAIVAIKGNLAQKPQA